MLRNGVSLGLVQFMDQEERHQLGLNTPFQRLARHMQDILGNGGIRKEVVREGEGPLVPRDASVSVHFSGFLEYADQPFESTRGSKFPKMMKLGKDVTLWGLDISLRTMRRGEFSRFLLQPRYAYGELGCPPIIPPGATVLYEVQVFDYLDSAKVDEFFALSLEEQNLVPLSKLLSVVETERSFGNHCFNKSYYEDAKDRYKQAMMLLRNREPVDEEERKRVEEASLPFLLNLSLTYLRLEKPRKALQFGQSALEISPRNTKALFRCGQACFEMNDYEKAQDYLTMAQARKPFDTDINNLLRKLAHRYNEELDKEKHMCSKMFSALKFEK
ncbi:inactive peptidyl-prolyl cis-trans isomerase FKBP6 [Ictalurus furcatus]|uniref:inactive peptidyl-prolyl cis-trans isomerase FKBP6 n=1 Tax=Ictalurus furcatus TaxID=66913 RepID=UPI002350EC6B|nr:inactive peptidyl-prolyl cis-trans isomerase FKBP6 [Ictalurus furcatus]XP_053474159.1 inactive peptidyl-prolyl cis-trans isomerase FKBP6 [Ictalurus furcatus]